MKKVLVINDSKFEGTILKDLLGKLGYDVRLSDEYMALGLVKTYQPHIVIVNYIMKEKTGDVYIEEIKKVSPDVLSYISSSTPLNMKDFKGLVEGILQTPVSMKNLVIALGDVLKERMCEEFHCSSK